MANQKNISQLDELTTISNDTFILVETNTSTNKATKANFLKEINDELENTYTKSEVDELIATVSSGGSINLDGYVTEEELAEGLEGYVTETELAEGLETKANIDDVYDKATVDQKISEVSTGGGNVDLSDYATKTELAEELASKVDVVEGKGLSTNDYTDEDITKINNLVNTIGDDNTGLIKQVNDIEGTSISNLNAAIENLETILGVDIALGDITNLPVGDSDITESINRINGELTNKANIDDVYDKVTVDQKIANAVTGGTIDLSGYATKTELTEGLASKANASDIPVVPTNVSEFINDAGYLTSHQDISGLATKAELEAKVDVVEGKGLSTNDYTDEDVTKINNLVTALGDDDAGLIKQVNDIETTTLSNLNTAVVNLETILGVDTALGDLASLPAYDTDITESIIRIDGELNAKANIDDVYNKATIDRKIAEAITAGNVDFVTETELAEELASKVDVVEGKGLSTNDYTDEDITKINNLVNTIGDDNAGLIKQVNDIETTTVSNLNTAIENLETILGVNTALGDLASLPVGDSDITESINRINSELNAKANIDDVYDKATVDQKISEVSAAPMSDTTLYKVTWASDITLENHAYQSITYSDTFDITLPSASSLSTTHLNKIHLFVTIPTEATPVIGFTDTLKWTSSPTLTGGVTIEYVFTYINDEWLAGFTIYGG